MSEGQVVKLPISILAGLVASAESHADGVQQLENLDHEWVVVERDTSRPTEVGGVTQANTMSRWFKTREELVAHLEASHIDQAIETLAVLRNGAPRVMKVNVKVQFR